MNKEQTAMRALESLTPGGSEFVGDIQRCVEHVRHSRANQIKIMRDWIKRRNKQDVAVRALLEAARPHLFEDARILEAYKRVAELFNTKDIAA